VGHGDYALRRPFEKIQAVDDRGGLMAPYASIVQVNQRRGQVESMSARWVVRHAGDPPLRGEGIPALCHQDTIPDKPAYLSLRKPQCFKFRGSRHTTVARE
jgi:hypothetical protein